MNFSITRLVVFIALIGVLVGAVYFVARMMPTRTDREKVDKLVQDRMAGDYGAVLQDVVSIKNDSAASRVARARAILNALGVGYRVSGDQAARITDVQDAKKIFLDTELPLEVRVIALNYLASLYPLSGSDPTVFAEIIKDEPFSKYVGVGENPDRTARLTAKNLFDWSYSLYPTSVAAISLARWYSEQVVFDLNMNRVKRNELLKTAEDYLIKADEAAQKELADSPEYVNSPRYYLYKYWRTVVIGRITVNPALRDKYDFRKEYEDFFAFAKAGRDPVLVEYVLYARLFMAGRLGWAVEGDDEGAKKQLDLLASEMSTIVDPEISVFNRFLTNEYRERPTGATWVNLVEFGMKFSTDFKAAVEKVVGPLQ